KIVLEVEAIEGTNDTIKRGGKLGRSKVVAFKLRKKGQDPRFDVPTIGTETIEYLKEAGVSTIAIQAKKTLILDKEDTIKLADKYKIAMVAV
ncbi:MAG: LpxI family protein, partial [Candidatus Brocadiaceae bacterium]|nr:LpxI family protein [Candidatus Brocadiaceae bacterium]